MNRAVFLDRDGVVNRVVVRDGKPYPPSGPDELEITPGVGPALQRLADAGFRLIVVTNQPDVARGTQTRGGVEAIHAELHRRLPMITDFRCCFHDDVDRCPCRKPAPGLLLEAARDLDIDLKKSYMIGDRWRDVEAGGAAGCRTVFIDYGYRERQPENPDKVVQTIEEAVEWILGEPSSADGTAGHEKAMGHRSTCEQ